MLCPNESWVSLDDFQPRCTCLYPHTTWTDAAIPSNTTRSISPTSPTPRSPMFGSNRPDSPISKYLENQDSFLYPECPRFNSFFDTNDVTSTFLSVNPDIWSVSPSDESLPASASSSLTSLSSTSLTDPFPSSSTLFQNSEEFFDDLLPSPSSSTTCFNYGLPPSRYLESDMSGLPDDMNLSATVYKDIWLYNTYDLFQDGPLLSSSSMSLPISPVSSFTNLSECNVSCSLTSLCHQGVSLPVPSRRPGPLNKMVDRKRKRDEDDEVEVKVCKRARL
ncbi:uncharacterized protein LOC124282468 isoform X2 [Haliotis rubra]|uniref:uncharacterized protein LOC124282468 isoform X1 n=1 Tax=Haliotis rubra TaxID=36100 RepID=UPI001EE51AD4|nr:uncharacterized protein LOC124282468 isoform X1 [Haliotis rubra]XP_046574429.1 uncharacterized protein LOC124282468 isoform X1 [Haliotis rubra]XP_046574430.1 uncharacterized protein LOC124282468 isoform X1 [Haliotis rubra]XP_046574431.1 uncharacterized protein LOC124282468 isoform X2 [Haliotis rubra]